MENNFNIVDDYVYLLDEPMNESSLLLWIKCELGFIDPLFLHAQFIGVPCWTEYVSCV